MASQKREVIDLTDSPKREVIVLDSDDEHDSAARNRDRKPSSSRDKNKFTLLERMTDVRVQKLQVEEEGEVRGGESVRKKRSKKRKKVSVVEEGEVEEDEVEQQDAGEEGGFSRKTSTLESKGKGKAKETDYGKPGSPSKNGPSLLE